MSEETSPAEVLASPESLITILGVTYEHRKTHDGGDMYFTRHGLPLVDHLALDNWYEREWFQTRRERLLGTGSVYRVPTKEVNDKRIELVVKNCRVGEDVPLDTHTLLEFINAEFNSPWEEFSLVMELRQGAYGPSDLSIRTQEPLAIYVPPDVMQLWQSGRSRTKMYKIMARHPGIGLDILRQYKMIYGWIPGRNIVELLMDAELSGDALRDAVDPLTDRVTADLDKKGYVVADMKAVHIIIDKEFSTAIDAITQERLDKTAQRQIEILHGLIENGQYSVVDYELMLRTPEHEEQVKYSRRHHYLDDQRDRFVPTFLPRNLHAMEIFGVPYIHGHVESTGGQLWVVGKNGRLFDYFLPERWRKTMSWKLSEENEVYYTVTKDAVHIVWETSRVGETIGAGKDDEYYQRAREYGFNSPFEEFAIAQALGDNHIPTVYVRAIYMTGTRKVEESADYSRYESHKSIVGYDRQPILRETHNYISIRGYYNGPDSWVAQQQGQLCRPIDLENAVDKSVITREDCTAIYDRTLSRLKNIGYDGSLLKDNDMLLAMDPEGKVLLDNEGKFEARICNFELIRKI